MKMIAFDPYTYIAVPDHVEEQQVKNMYPHMYFHLLEHILDNLTTETQTIKNDEERPVSDN
jgi:hypothetical protein